MRMKRLLLIATTLLGVHTMTQASCTYFRSAVKLEKCTARDPQKMPKDNPYDQPSDLPGFQEDHSQLLVEAVCSCEYSLKGADVRCDVDQEIEKSALFGTDEAKGLCRRGTSLCKEICPSRLP